jgi:hypothetical protein
VTNGPDGTTMLSDRTAPVFAERTRGDFALPSDGARLAFLADQPDIWLTTSDDIPAHYRGTR